jgi:hypothetical protein
MGKVKKCPAAKYANLFYEPAERNKRLRQAEFRTPRLGVLISSTQLSSGGGVVGSSEGWLIVCRIEFHEEECLYANR